MGYRTEDRPHHPPRRTMHDTATPGKVYAHNGTTAHLAIPCWYQEVHKPIRMKYHDRDMHDHVGWPDPARKDRSCQLYEPFEDGYPPEPPHTVMGGHPPVRKLLDMTRVFPIHLTSDYEGYSSARVAFVGDHEGIIATASIDPVQDWVVRVVFNIKDPNALEEPQSYKFTVFVDADTRQTRNPVTGQYGSTQAARSDIVCLGELVVLPSAY